MTAAGPPNIAAEIAGLQRFARALLVDPAAADGLVESTLLRAGERAGSYRRGLALRAWLAGILFRQFAALRRRQGIAGLRRALFPAPGRRGGGDGAPRGPTEAGRIAERFHRLPGEQRAVLHLVAIEGLTYAEAASALDIPVGTVLSRLNRARATLRDGTAPAGLVLFCLRRRDRD